MPILFRHVGPLAFYAGGMEQSAAGRFARPAVAWFELWLSCGASYVSGSRSIRTRKEREPMKIALVASAVIVMWSTTALAQQPAVYPLRSQPPAAQGVDSAYCYWQAKRQTGIDMTHLSQRPPRIKPIQSATDAGRGASAPPLPAHGAPKGATKTPKTLATASEASGASHGAGEPPPAARPNAASASEGSEQAAASAASASGVPGTATGAASASALANLPPLPPPQPPMTIYWQAYGDCMQARGYGVR